MQASEPLLAFTSAMVNGRKRGDLEVKRTLLFYIVCVWTLQQLLKPAPLFVHAFVFGPSIRFRKASERYLCRVEPLLRSELRTAEVTMIQVCHRSES
jgi:hypothetical protein